MAWRGIPKMCADWWPIEGCTHGARYAVSFPEKQRRFRLVNHDVGRVGPPTQKHLPAWRICEDRRHAFRIVKL